MNRGAGRPAPGRPDPAAGWPAARPAGRQLHCRGRQVQGKRHPAGTPGAPAGPAARPGAGRSRRQATRPEPGSRPRWRAGPRPARPEPVPPPRRHPPRPRWCPGRSGRPQERPYPRRPAAPRASGRLPWLPVPASAAAPRALPSACGPRAPRSSMTPSERTRPFPGAWPSRPCSLRRTPSRARIPGPSPLRSLYSVRSNRTSQPVRGSACSVRRQPVLFIAACSSGAHCHLSLLSLALFPSLPFICLAPGWQPSRQSAPPQDTRRSRRSLADPAGAAPAATPGAVVLAQSIPGWDAGMRPGRAFAPAGRGQPHPRPLPGEANQTWLRGHRTPHTSGSLTLAGEAAGTAWPFLLPSLQCRRVPGTGRGAR